MSVTTKIIYNILDKKITQDDKRFIVVDKPGLMLEFSGNNYFASWFNGNTISTNNFKVITSAEENSTNKFMSYISDDNKVYINGNIEGDSTTTFFYPYKENQYFIFSNYGLNDNLNTSFNSAAASLTYPIYRIKDFDGAKELLLKNSEEEGKLVAHNIDNDTLEIIASSVSKYTADAETGLIFNGNNGELFSSNILTLPQTCFGSITVNNDDQITDGNGNIFNKTNSTLTISYLDEWSQAANVFSVQPDDSIAGSHLEFSEWKLSDDGNSTEDIENNQQLTFEKKNEVTKLFIHNIVSSTY